MSTAQSPGQTIPSNAADVTLESLRIPEPYASSLPLRAARAAVRVHKAVGVWPWDLVPEAPPKQWAINLMEDLALVSEHVARSPNETVEDLRAELRRSMSRDRKPSYAGKLMAQDVQAAKKRFVRRHGDALPTQPNSSDKDSDPQPPRRRRTATSSVPPTPSHPAPTEKSPTPNTNPDADDDDPSSITVASDVGTSPLVPRIVRPPKRPAPAVSNPTEKRTRANSPDGSRLSAAQSLMLFSSPLSVFQIAPSMVSSPTAGTSYQLHNNHLHDSLKPATDVFLAAIDSHVLAIRASLVSAQKEIFPHRGVHQEAVRRYRAREATVRKVEGEITAAEDKLIKLHEETAEQDALAPQLHALQENNMTLPPEIAQAIRSYDSRRIAKTEEVRKQETVIDEKIAELETAKEELRAAEAEAKRLDADIQDLQVSVSQGAEAERLAKLYGVMVRLGPRGLAGIEHIYPEIGSLLDSLLATNGNLVRAPSQAQEQELPPEASERAATVE